MSNPFAYLQGWTDALRGVRAAIAISAVIECAGECADIRECEKDQGEIVIFREVSSTWDMLGRDWNGCERPYDGLTPQEEAE